ncbi:MAG TPA: TIR domain-containing protein [Solirubrobacterales bacterium]|nr:TIR domain-containing protein [Solirubrobacterales bacterium]
MTSRYDAFVSYGHGEERGVARRLQSGVERFGKPWYRTRALRLFLDTNSLSADPKLWATIERALGDSEWFVLVTSPKAVGSRWVDREIRWWLEHRSAGRLLIVLAEGHLEWDQARNDFDPTISTALPPALMGAFEEEPHWVTVPSPEGGDPGVSDRGLDEAVVDIAMPLRGLSKEDLVGVAERERKRTLRWVRGVIAGLSLLLIAAVAGGLIALHQRGVAVDEAERALSRQIASTSEAVAETNLDTAMLLAAQAFRTDANPQTRAALFNAATSSSSLVRFLDAGGEVEALTGSGDGDSVVAGLEDGRVLLWRDGSGVPTELGRFGRGVGSVAISDDGSIIAAADGAKALLWRDGEDPVQLPVPTGSHSDMVGLSPSGETVVYQAYPPGYEASDSITVAAVDDLSARTVHWDAGFGSLFGSIVVPSDSRLLFVGGGSWEWKRFSDWSGESGTVGLGAHEFATAISADGRFFTKTNGNPLIQVWRTTGSASAEDPDATAEAPLPQQTALALSPDGGKVAVAGPGEIYVAEVAGDDGLAAAEAAAALDPSSRPVTLTGQTPGLVEFADATHLLTVSGQEVGVWDLEQLDRLAVAETVPLERGCEACGPPTLSISPDGKRLAVTDGAGWFGSVQSLAGDAERELLPPSETDFLYGNPVWDGASESVAFPVWATAGGADPPLPALSPSGDVHAWTAGQGSGYELTEATAPDGETAIVVDRAGGVYWQDIATGAEREFSPGPAIQSYQDEEADSAALSPSLGLLAMADDGVVRVERLTDRKLLGSIDVGGFPAVAFAGNRLLVQEEGGSVQVWNETGTELQRMLPGSGGSALMAANRDGTLLARSGEDGTVGLADLGTGVRLGAFQTPGRSSFFRSGLAFSPDGDTLFVLSETPSYDGEIVRRDLSDTALVDSVCDASGRDLTVAEWNTFVGADPPADLSCR